MEAAYDTHRGQRTWALRAAGGDSFVSPVLATGVLHHDVTDNPNQACTRATSDPLLRSALAERIAVALMIFQAVCPHEQRAPLVADCDLLAAVRIGPLGGRRARAFAERIAVALMIFQAVCPHEQRAPLVADCDLLAAVRIGPLGGRRARAFAERVAVALVVSPALAETLMVLPLWQRVAFSA